MLLLRALSRLLGTLVCVAVALLGLGVAMYCFDALISLGSARPDRLLHLPTVRDRVGHFLAQLASPGPTAALALAGGVVAVLLALLLLLGALRRSRVPLVVLSDTAEGRLAARPGVLRSLARGLAARAPGVTAVRHPRIKLSRGGTRGRLIIRAARASTTDGDEVRRALATELDPVTGPFHLRPRIRVGVGEPGERVQ